MVNLGNIGKFIDFQYISATNGSVHQFWVNLQILSKKWEICQLLTKLGKFTVY
jgi:hypothetical protein